jgi:hypothetical protein
MGKSRARFTHASRGSVDGAASVTGWDIPTARARGRKGGRPRIETPEKLRYAQHLTADRERSIPAICRELGDLPASMPCRYVHADGLLKAPGRALLPTGRHAPGRNPSGEESPSARSRVSLAPAPLIP